MNKLIQFQQETEQNMDFEIHLETRRGYFVCLLIYSFVSGQKSQPFFSFPTPVLKQNCTHNLTCPLWAASSTHISVVLEGRRWQISSSGGECRILSCQGAGSFCLLLGPLSVIYWCIIKSRFTHPLDSVCFQGVLQCRSVGIVTSTCQCLVPWLARSDAKILSPTCQLAKARFCSGKQISPLRVN